MGFVVVIPARFGSTRLRGKPLQMVAGRPLIAHVHARAKASAAEEVIIATDHPQIRETAEAFGAVVCMTDDRHPSGTDRIAEVAQIMGLSDEQVVVNLQGDEPLMPPLLLDQVAANLEAQGQASAATLCQRLEQAEALFDPHVVKVVRDAQDFALYFSRAPIPWDREAFAGGARGMPPGDTPYYRHIGLYAYRAGFIREYVRWSPCPPERSEALEQLRILWHGHRIHVAEACAAPGHGVDTEEDLRRAEALLRAMPA